MLGSVYGIHYIPGVSLPRRKMGVSGGVGKTPPFQKKKKKKRSPIMRRMLFFFCAGISKSQDQLRWIMKEKSIPTMDNEEQNSRSGYFLCFITLRPVHTGTNFARVIRRRLTPHD